MNKLTKLNKNFWLALPLLALLIYGLFAQYMAYQAGLLPQTGPEKALAVSGFDAEKPEGSVIVAVSGAVKKQGYYAVPGEMSLRDFLDFLGLQSNSDISAWDLAHQPQQGDQYYIASEAEDLAAREWLIREPAGEPENEPAGVEPEEERLNINRATLEELQQLPDIGPSRAQAIIDYRVEHNGFRYVEELLGVKGIGDKIYNQLKDRVTV